MIDMRHSRWGHALHYVTKTSETDTRQYYKADMHCTPGPRVGNKVLVPSKSGKGIMMHITDVKGYMDPDDFYNIKMERRAEDE